MTDQRKVVIKAADMPEIQKEVIDLTLQAFNKFTVEKDIASHIKRTLDTRHGPTFHVIVGRSFGSIEMCCICQEPIITRGKIAGCKHMFCYTCIFKWSTHENSCPICRQRFPTILKIIHPFSKTPQTLFTLKVETKDQSNRHQETANRLNFTDTLFEDSIFEDQIEDIEIIQTNREDIISDSEENQNENEKKKEQEQERENEKGKEKEKEKEKEMVKGKERKKKNNLKYIKKKEKNQRKNKKEKNNSCEARSRHSNPNISRSRQPTLPKERTKLQFVRLNKTKIKKKQSKKTNNSSILNKNKKNPISNQIKIKNPVSRRINFFSNFYSDHNLCVSNPQTRKRSRKKIQRNSFPCDFNVLLTNPNSNRKPKLKLQKKLIKKKKKMQITENQPNRINQSKFTTRQKKGRNTTKLKSKKNNFSRSQPKQIPRLSSKHKINSKKSYNLKKKKKPLLLYNPRSIGLLNFTVIKKKRIK
ncbi:dynein light chain [Anaeramoeba flamelloides]|uniref:Dynein light chain n=1 Tax=Anaeramoeba flamelloides TaxID=1746091 RepID=A0AAV7Z822_9EUKA|nr:dynein light chain [Anaeramoeba flamelloides]